MHVEEILNKVPEFLCAYVILASQVDNQCIFDVQFWRVELDITEHGVGNMKSLNTLLQSKADLFIQ